mmetsp:Transcript_44956/g.105990  ORF Transcript_44956/g.105990 Transcript_44956/m.105990 type:complete len:373 (-) Transcript_44956:98-1216(-)
MFIDEYLDSPPVLTILIVDGQGEVLLGTAGSLPLYPRRPSIWFETPHNQTLVMLQHSGTAVVDLNVRTRDVKVGEDFCHLEIVQGQRLLGRFYEPKIQLAVTVEEAGTLTFYARLVDASHHVISHDSTKVEVSAKRVTQTHAAALRNHQNSDREHLSHRSELFNLIGRGVSTVCEVGFGGQGSSTMLWLHQSNVDQVVCFDTFDFSPRQKEYRDAIKEKEAERFAYHTGDSTVTVPAFADANPNFVCDVVFVDGEHFGSVPFADLLNLQRLATEDTVVIADDCAEILVQDASGRVEIPASGDQWDHQSGSNQRCAHCHDVRLAWLHLVQQGRIAHIATVPALAGNTSQGYFVGDEQRVSWCVGRYRYRDRGP